MKKANSVVILDFETTGLSPVQGDRAIEIGAVRLVDGKVEQQFQRLMNPGRPISAFIAQYTGITNQMLATAQPCAQVMAEFADFIADDNLIAHNAQFDKRFLDAELERIGRHYSGQFGCSLLVSRRLFQQAPNHKLGTLVDFHNLAVEGDFHRALFDAQMTAKVWQVMLNHISYRYNIKDIPFSLMQKVAKTSKSKVATLLGQFEVN